jgi:hypothetical protein
MQKKQNLVDAVPPAAIKPWFSKYRKPIIIITSITVLQLLFGFDAKFSIINIIWLFV